MNVLLLGVDSRVVASIDVPAFDDIPKVVLWQERVFIAHPIAGPLVFIETIALRLELPAGAGL